MRRGSLDWILGLLKVTGGHEGNPNTGWSLVNETTTARLPCFGQPILVTGDVHSQRLPDLSELFLQLFTKSKTIAKENMRRNEPSTPTTP